MPTNPSWSNETISLAVGGVLMHLDNEGHPTGISGELSTLLDSHAGNDDPAIWIAKVLRPRLEAFARDGADHIVALPEELGGITLVARVLPDGDNTDGGHIVVLKDRKHLDALQGDLRLATRMREIAARFQQTAHDLKAPLQALALNLALIREDLESADVDEDVVDRVGILDGEVARLQRMLTSVMSDWKLPKASGLRRVDVQRLLREIAALVRPQATSAGVDMNVSLPPKLLVMASRDELKQAIVNIVNNAIEALATAAKSRARHLEISAENEDDCVLIRIADNGPGVAEAIRDRIFSLHFSTKSKGSGIGLFTARMVIERLGGSLELDTEEGKGTTVLLRLPHAPFSETPISGDTTPTGETSPG